MTQTTRHHDVRRRAGEMGFALRRAALGATALAALAAPAGASSIFGTLSNFDIYNTTPEPSEGAEIELEGIHSSEIGGDFPAHYGSRTIVEYTDSANNFAGSRIRYTGYNFAGAPTPGSLLPNPNPVTTNGHELTYTAGGEHFGFWLTGAQPTATRFFWLNDLGGGNYARIGSVPETVPGPTWEYVPPVDPPNPVDPPQPAVLQAVIKVAEPIDPNAPRPDSTWMKIYKTKLDFIPPNMQDLLEKLISGDPLDPNYLGVAPQGEIEQETEWELLEGGKNPKEKMKEDQLGEDDKVVIRRYEFYQYIGPIDEENEPVSLWESLGDPLHDPGVDVLDDQGNVIFAAERGDFIAANMVAAVLGDVVPEPSTSLLAAGAALLVWRRRRGGTAV